MTTHSQRALLALLLLATGCRFTFLQDDLERIQRRATLAGDVVVDDWEDAPVVIAVIEPPDRRGDPIRMLRSLVLEQPGRYAFQLEEGVYVVVAFEDVNRNERIDEGEQGAWLPAVHLDVRQEVHDHDVRIDRPFPHRDIDTSTLVDDRQRINGEVAALSDERLGARAGITGVWQPLVMMERYHPGLYLLEEYDADKTPVLFVPGLGGNAPEFGKMIAALDSERFQPWVYTHPSGMRLAVNATALHAALHEAHVRYPLRAHLPRHTLGRRGHRPRHHRPGRA